MDGSFFLIVAIGILVFVAVVLVSYRQQQKRIEEMRALAQVMGYQYQEGAAAPDEALAGFALFSQGHTRRATNLLSTEVDGSAAKIMDYRYESGYGKSRRIETQSVLLLESGRLDLPAFVLRPEGLFQKLAGFLGQQDIDFEGHPDFSESYVLQGSDERQLRALFNGEMLSFLAWRPGLCIEGHGRRLLYYRASKLATPAAIPSFLAEGLEVLHLMADAEPPAPASEPDSLAGLDELLSEIGIEDGPPVEGV
jgi:hypothetical protein